MANEQRLTVPVTVELDLSDGPNWTEFCKRLEAFEAELSAHPNAKVDCIRARDCGSYSEDVVGISGYDFTYTRPETDEEMAARIHTERSWEHEMSLQQQRKDSVEKARRYAEYQRLREEFEGKGEP